MHYRAIGFLTAVCAGILVGMAFGTPASANCIAHQPAEMQFTPPDNLGLQWECVTAGPWGLNNGPWAYNNGSDWYFITFKVTNENARRTEALKMQANMVDAFGDILLTVPIAEEAQLGRGNFDEAVFGFHNPVPSTSISHVDFSLVAVQYADGGVWQNPDVPKTGPLAGPQIAIQRFPMSVPRAANGLADAAIGVGALIVGVFVAHASEPAPSFKNPTPMVPSNLHP
jgi:hypothetical protein